MNTHLWYYNGRSFLRHAGENLTCLLLVIVGMVCKQNIWRNRLQSIQDLTWKTCFRCCCH